MEFYGIAYVLEKKSEKWQTTKKLGLKGEKNKITLSSTDEGKTKFPKINSSSYISRKTVLNDYWGFLDSNGTQAKAPGDQSDQHGWKWNSSSNPNYNLVKWSSNLDVWWDHFFGKSKWNMQELVKSIQGNWS